MKMQSIREQVDKNGYGVIENFLSESEIEKVKRAGNDLITESMAIQNRALFLATGKGDAPQASDRYFVDSADKISFFHETEAFNADGTYKVDPMFSLNKVGHALHRLNPTFREITVHERVKRICRELELKKPAVVQSMYIYKNPQIGGEVGPHQDGTYLYTEPCTLYGLWIPLDDATEENGCLWFIPGSHKSQISCRFIRNPNLNAEKLCVMVGPALAYDEKQFKITPVKKGSCVVIHGNVVHRSLPNRSPSSRNAYTFHVYDSAVSKYSSENWLQADFTSLYDD